MRYQVSSAHLLPLRRVHVVHGFDGLPHSSEASVARTVVPSTEHLALFDVLPPSALTESSHPAWPRFNLGNSLRGSWWQSLSPTHVTLHLDVVYRKMCLLIREPCRSRTTDLMPTPRRSRQPRGCLCLVAASLAHVQRSILALLGHLLVSVTDPPIWADMMTWAFVQRLGATHSLTVKHCVCT